jgi:signal recognition particle subunit SRP54
MFDFLSSTFSSLFSRLGKSDKLTEQNIAEALGQVYDALLEADVPYDVAQAFVQEVKQEVVGQKVMASLKPAEQLMKIVHDKLLYFLGGQSAETTFSFQIPSTIMVLGLQGSGKTTTVAKLAAFVQENAQKRGKKRAILFGSVDFYRPAAVDQLEILAKQVGVSFYRATSKDPVKAAQEIISYSQKHQFELLFLDTAGRLHVDNELLHELRQIDTIAKPKYKLLVLDAMTGQESLQVARAFDQAVGFSGVILTKMDSQARAGAAFAFRYALKKPILFVGMGEKIADL